MSGRNLYADTRLTFRNDRIIEACHVNTFLLQFGGEHLTQLRIIQHDRTDRRLRRLDIKTSRFHLLNEISGILVQTVLQLIGAGQDLEGLDTGWS